MRQSTQNFCKIFESTRSVRKALKLQVSENRFAGYVELLKSDRTLASLAKEGNRGEIISYLRTNNGSLGLPVRLTDRGIRRMAQALILNYKEV